MGTRGAVGFKLEDKYYVTHNHFDSYAKGLGAEVVKFCKYVDEKSGWVDLSKKVKKLKMVGLDDTPSEYCKRKYKKFSNTGVSEQRLDDWYCLMRELQFGEILWEIEKGTVTHMINQFDFMADSLFCEFGYIINLDEMTLDFYRGFQHKPSDNGLPFPMVADEGGYYPVKLRVKFDMNALPSNWLK